MRALFPATFDPVTNGHMDILGRSIRCFESIVVGVYADPRATTLFSVGERVEMLREATSGFGTVDVQTYAGLTVDFAKEVGAGVLIRGLRAFSDFEYEFAQSAMNRRLDPDIDTVFFLASPDHGFVSSSLVREVGALGRSVAEFVPTNVAGAVAEKFAGSPGR